LIIRIIFNILDKQKPGTHLVIKKNIFNQEYAMEIFFVLGFFVMLLLTGVSLLGIILAVIVASVVMMFAGLLMMVVKMLPWLALAVAIVWIYRAYKKPSATTKRWISR